MYSPKILAGARKYFSHFVATDGCVPGAALRKRQLMFAADADARLKSPVPFHPFPPCPDPSFTRTASAQPFGCGSLPWGFGAWAAGGRVHRAPQPPKPAPLRSGCSRPARRRLRCVSSVIWCWATAIWWTTFPQSGTPCTLDRWRPI